MILDATCSIKRIWPKVADVRMDISPLAHPDVVGDCKRLPFADESFDSVYCDPPHLTGKAGIKRVMDPQKTTPTFARYSRFENPAAWIRFVHAATNEFYRVLKPHGFLRWKLPDGSRSHGTMVHYADAFDPRFGTVADISVPSKGPFSRLNVVRGHRPCMIHYLTLEKIC